MIQRIFLLSGISIGVAVGCGSSDHSPPAPAPMRDAAPSAPAPSLDDGGSAPPQNTCVGADRLDAYVSDPKLCVYVFAKDLGGARQLAFTPSGDLFVSNGALTLLWDADGDGRSAADERAKFASAPGLNHGVALPRAEGYVYASSDTTVYRWAYAKGQRSASGDAEVVVSGMPSGGHNSRTLAFDSRGRLYVSVGSGSNVDQAQADLQQRSQIRRYTVPDRLPSGGLRYASGETIASGMRNEAGIFVDAEDKLWGVENGRDNLSHSELGGDIHNDNPGEEINFVDGRGATFYGYPNCFSEFAANGGKGRGTQWADQSLAVPLRKDDAFCRDVNNVHPPAFVMPAHWAPLGIIQYTGHSLPFTGDLIVGAHGSWNRAPASGRVIAHARVEAGTVTELTPIVGEKGADGQLQQGTWDVRPVDVRQGPDQAIYVSDDLGGRVLKIGYER